MNMLNIGMDMSEVLLPQIEMSAKYNPGGGDNDQINSSSIYSYLNIRGVGRTANGTAGTVKRYFNAIPYLGYWDIYKNYYANKQEERGFVIHADTGDVSFDLSKCFVTVNGNTVVTKEIAATDQSIDTDPQGATGQVITTMEIRFVWNNNNTVAYGSPDVSNFEIDIDGNNFLLSELFGVINVPTVPEGGLNGGYLSVQCSDYLGALGVADWDASQNSSVPNTEGSNYFGEPILREFPLDNIDDMRMDILEAVRDTTAFKLDETSRAPYGLGLGS